MMNVHGGRVMSLALSIRNFCFTFVDQKKRDNAHVNNCFTVCGTQKTQMALNNIK